MDENYGKKIYKLLIGVLVVGGILGVIWFVNASKTDPPTPKQQAREEASGCRELFDIALALERSGQTGDGRMDEALDGLRRCPTEYDVLTDYIQAKVITDTAIGIERCAANRGYIRREAIQLLREDGLCTG